MDNQTPLYDRHVALSGRMVSFAGYLLPVQYETGVIAEHKAVRERAGLFDVSHMGEFFLTGRDALCNLNALLTNSFSDLAVGRARYSLMCYDGGGCVDDLIVSRVGTDAYLIVVNASNREKDAAWLRAHLTGDVCFTDASDETALLALQGPASERILRRLVPCDSIPQRSYSFTAGVPLAGMTVTVSRTGYTGEDGFELFVPSADAGRLFDLLLEAGDPDGLIPCGLGARDTLRLEAAMPLYGHEMDETVDPLEAGLGFAFKPDKPFIGRDAVLAKGEPKQRRVGLAMVGRGIAREGQDVYRDGERIGRTTSGTHCPTLGRAVAMARVDAAHAAVGTRVEADVRGRRIEAEIVPLPFYRRAR